MEYLDTVVDTVANIQQIVVRQLRTVDGIPKLLRGRIVGIVAPQIGIIGLMPVRAPVALVLAGFGIEHDHAMIPVPVGNISLVGLRVDENLGGQPQIRDVVAALALVRLADLHQEFSLLRELEDHVVVERFRAADLAFVVGGLIAGSSAAASTAAASGAWSRASSVAADPYVAFVVHRDAVIGIRPVVARSRTTPVTDQIAFFIELEYRRRGSAALRRRRIGGGVDLAGLERTR